MRPKFITFRKKNGENTEPELARLERLYKQESLRAHQLDLEREHLEAALEERERIIAGQESQIRATQRVLRGYEKQVGEELKSLEDEHKGWMQEKRRYEEKLRGKALNGGIRLDDSASVCEQDDNQESAKSEPRSDAGSSISEVSLNTSLESKTKSRSTADSDLEKTVTSPLLEELKRLANENSALNLQIASLKAELAEATAQFTELNDSMSYREIFDEIPKPESPENGLALQKPTLEKEIEANDLHKEHDHKQLDHKEHDFEKELSLVSSQVSAMSEYRHLVQQYRSQQVALRGTRYELAAARLEVSQLVSFLGVLLGSESAQNVVGRICGPEPEDQAQVVQELVEDSKHKFWNKNKKKDINGVLKRARSVSSVEESGPGKQGLNLRYFKKNNRINRIILNNVDSAFSIETNGNKRHTIGTMENRADDSVLLELKPLKILKHREEEHKGEIQEEPGNVSLNASIDMKGLRKGYFRRSFKRDDQKSISSEELRDNPAQHEQTQDNTEHKETTEANPSQEDEHSTTKPLPEIPEAALEVESIESAVPFDDDPTVLHNLREFDILEESSFNEPLEESSFVLTDDNMCKISLYDKKRASWDLAGTNPLIALLLRKLEHELQMLLEYNIEVEVD